MIMQAEGYSYSTGKSEWELFQKQAGNPMAFAVNPQSVYHGAIVTEVLTIGWKPIVSTSIFDAAQSFILLCDMGSPGRNIEAKEVFIRCPMGHVHRVPVSFDVALAGYKPIRQDSYEVVPADRCPVIFHEEL